MKNLFIVIHVDSEEQLFRNLSKIEGIKLSGVFLISHGSMTYKELYNLGKKVKREYPDLWIGYNFLDLTANEAVSFLQGKDVDGLWVDNAYLGLNKLKLDTLNRLTAKDFTAKLYGGFYFKGQPQPRDMKLACEDARTIDVPVTSGVATGMAADLDKISRLKKELGDHPLGIASGITVENVNDYLPFIDVFLVATGVSDSFTELNKDKVQALSYSVFS